MDEPEAADGRVFAKAAATGSDLLGGKFDEAEFVVGKVARAAEPYRAGAAEAAVRLPDQPGGGQAAEFAGLIGGHGSVPPDRAAEQEPDAKQAANQEGGRPVGRNAIAGHGQTVDDARNSVARRSVVLFHGFGCGRVM